MILIKQLFLSIFLAMLVLFVALEGNAQVLSGQPTDALATQRLDHLWELLGIHIFNTNFGNVGIGTSFPQAKLEVNGTAIFRDITQVFGGEFEVLDGDAGGKIFYDSLSNVFGIKTYPAFSIPISFATSGVERMRIGGDGNVGIGIDVPTQKLEVSGGVKLNTSDIKPICDENTRGTLWYNKSVVGDRLEVCKLVFPAGIANIVVVPVTLPSSSSLSLSCVENSATHKIYCFGGAQGGIALNSIIEYTPITTSVITKSVLPSPSEGPSCAENSATNKIYCFGGISGSSMSNVIVEYNSIADTAVIKPQTLPQPSFGLACAENSATHKIYCFGGWILDSIIEYDPSTGNLAVKSAKLPSGRFSVSCAENSATHKIYCFGGASAGGVQYDSILEYDPVLDVLTTLQPKLPSPRHAFSCAEDITTNKIYCFGGDSGGAILDEIVEYDTNNMIVSILTTTLPSPLKAHSCTRDSSTHLIYCLGGTQNKILQFGSLLSNIYSWFHVA